MRGRRTTRSVSALLFIAAAWPLWGCGNNPHEPFVGLPRDLTPAESQLISSDNNFGLKLFREISAQEDEKSVFVSPLSVSMALGMTYNGAAGETETAMRDVLELGGLSLTDINESYKSLIELLRGLDSNVIFQIANSIWYRNDLTFEPEFIDLNKRYFDAEVAGLDFGDAKAIETMNRWVDEKTGGKIEDIVEKIEPQDIMFLINAIYFKGAWTHRFDKNDTRNDTFTRPDGSEVPCMMMARKADVGYFEAQDLQIVDLPYGEGEYSMTILLPAPDAGLDALIGRLDDEHWTAWLDGLQEEEVSLQMPRLKLEYKLKLNDVLTALGMGIAFDVARADFSRMYPGGPGIVWIDRVMHKTFVEVNEEGTEAAAATSVVMQLRAVGISVRVDRPFVFAIRENYSGTILFIGKVIEPSAG